MKSGFAYYRAFSGGILLVVLAMLFTLCVGPANSASEPGTVTVVIANEPPTLDPHYNVMGMEGQMLMKTVVEPLTGINPEDGGVNLILATSWKQVDPNTWHFVLRKGVKFHDGEDFNADAVILSIKRLYDKRIQSRVKAKFFSNIKIEGKALDSHTLEAKTDKPEPLLPTLMAFLPISSPKTPMDKWIRNPVGTGPYKFVKWDAGGQIIYERFDGYWGKQPQVKKAIYIWRSESSVRAAMVEIGEADLALDIARQDAKRPDMDHSYVNTETVHIRFGGEWEPPLNDRRVRMALNYAIDRNSFRGSILGKDVIPATQVVLPRISGHNPDLKVWPYDPQKARQLLDEARKDGVPVDKEISLVGRIAHYPGSGELLEALMTMYKAVGLNVKLKIVEVGVYRPYQIKPYPTNAGPYLLHGQHDNNYGDAAFTLPYLYSCKGLISVTCDKTVDDLIEKATVATGEERKNLWRTAFKRISEEIIPDAMLYHMVAYTRVGKRINFKPFIVNTNEIQLSQITFKQ